MNAKQIKAYIEVKRFWALMCNADGIDPTSQFVVFNDKNPHFAAYNRAMTTYQKLMKGAR